MPHERSRSIVQTQEFLDLITSNFPSLRAIARCLHSLHLSTDRRASGKEAGLMSSVCFLPRVPWNT